jgi:hypothetical protein
VFKLLKGYKKRRAVIAASFFIQGKPQVRFRVRAHPCLQRAHGCGVPS